MKKFSKHLNFVSWSHFVELLKFNDINEIKYYINKTKFNHLRVRELRKIIKEKEHERIPESTKKKLNKTKKRIYRTNRNIYEDYNLKGINDDKTIGLIVKKKNKNM